MWNWNAALLQLNQDMLAFAAGVLFMLPLRRRDRFLRRAVLTLGLGAGASLLLSLLQVLAARLLPPSAVDLLRLVALYLLLVLQNRVCARVKPTSDFYCAAWAFAAPKLFLELWVVLCTVFPNVIPNHILLSDLWVVLGYCVLGLTVVRWMPDKGEYHIGPRQMTLTALLLILFGVMHEYFFYLVDQADAGRNVTDLLLTVAVVQCYCVTMLYLQNILFQKSAMKHELTTLNLLWQQSKAQYDLSKENIALLNRKVHDLKHQMEALKTLVGPEEREQYVAEVENAVRIYDSIVKTGNEALDTILTEKSLYCEANHIQINCVVDGARLDFINSIDLYAIFGNALSNAIECVQRIQDPCRRVIDVLVYVKQQFLAINVINPLEETLTFEDGLPVTTKGSHDYHGFGLKSIRHTVQQYGGFVTVGAEKGCFSLRILFPLPN